MDHIKTRLLSTLFLVNGIMSLILSIYINSNIVAIIGLGLVFWGAFLLYIEPKRDLQMNMLKAASTSLLKNIKEITTSFNYNGLAVHLPSNYFPEERQEKLFINWGKGDYIPKIEESTNELKVNDSKGLLISPPGLNLINYYEKEMGITFSKIKLIDIHNILFRLFVKDLEIVKNLEINIVGDRIFLRLTEPIYTEIYLRTHLPLPDPFCSSFALAFARSTHKPIIIENIEIYDNGDILEIKYKICGE